MLQDGKLFPGDIFSNITMSAPWLTMDDAWEAAEKAGIADSIRSLPMGMHTFITEGAGGISGGQRQRLIIARAIATKARILMFDEATSALDNITQKIVTDSLNAMKCTSLRHDDSLCRGGLLLRRAGGLRSLRGVPSGGYGNGAGMCTGH